MRSIHPIEGNPWPHDMVLTIEDRPSALLDLLWIRETYQLNPSGDDLPPLLSASHAVIQENGIERETRIEWESAWPRLWHSALAHAGTDVDPGLFDAVSRTTAGSAERLELIGRMFGPTWRDAIGPEAFDTDAYVEWSRRGMDAHHAALPKGLDESPERRDLEAVIPAWRAGLTRVVAIPCAGVHNRKVGSNALLVTTATRDDSAGYRRALGTFVDA